MSSSIRRIGLPHTFGSRPWTRISSWRAAEQRKLDLFASMPKGPRELGEANFTGKCAIIVGSEGRGISERLRGKALDVRIPTAGVESLNAALAAGIVLYVARKQRMAAT